MAGRYECIPILEDEGTMILENVGNFQLSAWWNMFEDVNLYMTF